MTATATTWTCDAFQTKTLRHPTPSRRTLPLTLRLSGDFYISGEYRLSYTVVITNCGFYLGFAPFKKSNCFPFVTLKSNEFRARRQKLVPGPTRKKKKTYFVLRTKNKKNAFKFFLVVKSKYFVNQFLQSCWSPSN